MGSHRLASSLWIRIQTRDETTTAVSQSLQCGFCTAQEVFCLKVCTQNWADWHFLPPELCLNLQVLPGGSFPCFPHLCSCVTSPGSGGVLRSFIAYPLFQGKRPRNKFKLNFAHNTDTILWHIRRTETVKKFLYNSYVNPYTPQRHSRRPDSCIKKKKGEKSVFIIGGHTIKVSISCKFTWPDNYRFLKRTIWSKWVMVCKHCDITRPLLNRVEKQYMKPLSHT